MSSSHHSSSSQSQPKQQQQSNFAHSSTTPAHKYDEKTFITPPYYIKKKPVGVGAYGIIVAAEDSRTQTKVAIKKVENAFVHQTDMKRTLREMRILARFNHENLIGIKEVFKTTNFEEWSDVYWVTELMDTDLYKIIVSPQALSEEHVQYFLYQMLRGLKYIHSANILHRDLKPSNILLNQNCDLKIADFGLAKPVNETEKHLMTEYVVTRWYRAPEIILTWKHYTKTVDIWSVGCIFAEMLSRRPLFPGKDYLHQLRLIIDVIGSPTDEDLSDIENERAKKYVKSLPQKRKIPWNEYFAKYGVKIGPEASDLLDKMLPFDPKKRISVEDALAHPYLESLHDVSGEPVANMSFNFDYEQYLSNGKEKDKDNQGTLKHLIFQEMLKFHPENAAEVNYNPSPEIYAIAEIANPGFLSRKCGIKKPSNLPVLVPQLNPEEEKEKEKEREKEKQQQQILLQQQQPQSSSRQPSSSNSSSSSSHSSSLHHGSNSSSDMSHSNSTNALANATGSSSSSSSSQQQPQTNANVNMGGSVSSRRDNRERDGSSSASSSSSSTAHRGSVSGSSSSNVASSGARRKPSSSSSSSSSSSQQQQQPSSSSSSSSSSLSNQQQQPQQQPSSSSSSSSSQSLQQQQQQQPHSSSSSSSQQQGQQSRRTSVTSSSQQQLQQPGSGGNNTNSGNSNTNNPPSSSSSSSTSSGGRPSSRTTPNQQRK